MKKIISVLSLIVLSICMLSLQGCKKYDYKVGICQLVTHEALDEATRGFKDALEEEMEKAGKSVYFDYQNASGDSQTCVTIVNKFVTKNYSLIMANATPALQAAFNATETIPVLGTSITTYSEALGITLNENDTTGINISGTSDLSPLDAQAQMILDFLPEVTTVGILYCSSEANSAYQVNKVKGFLEQAQVEVKLYSFTDSNDVSAVCNQAASEVEAIYIPTDNVCASNKALIGPIFKAQSIPVFVGEANLCDVCGCATISISYYEIGKMTGLMAAKILLEGKNVSELPISYDPNPMKLYNKDLCDELGLTVPQGFSEIE